MTLAEIPIPVEEKAPEQIGKMTEEDWQRLELEMMIETLTYNRG